LGANVRAALRRANLPAHVWSDELARFYERTDAFLYELVAWNRNPLKLAMRRWIGRFFRHWSPPREILCFGDGLGFDSLFLAQLGQRVTYFEVSSLCVQVARELFRAANGNLFVALDPLELPAESFDAVPCLDVLEHALVPSEQVRFLAQRLRPGGCLLTHAPFYYLAPSVCTHLCANLTLSGALDELYGPYGLRLLDGQLFWMPLVLGKPGPSGQAIRCGALRRFALRMTGLLFSGAGYWPAPYAWVSRLLTRSNPKWRRALASYSP
jgi:SAM-dependent methyltransferase